MRRILFWVAVAFGGLVTLGALVMITAVLWLRSDGGLDWLRATVETAASGPGQHLTLSGVTGALPFHVRVGRIDLADATGPWLTLSDAQFDLNSAALLGGTLEIEDLAAHEIHILRRPVAAPAEKPKSSSGLSLPKLPVAVALDRLDLSRIALDAPVLGAPVLLSASGQASLTGARLSAALDVIRHDAPGALNASIGYGVKAAEQLDVAIRADEPSGMLLAAVLPGGDKRPLTANLAGSGPLASWRGRLDVGAGPDATIAANIALARLATDTTATIDGTAAITPLLPPSMQGAVTGPISFGAHVAIADAGPLGFDQLKIVAGSTAVTGQGRYDGASGSVNAELDADADMAPFSGLAGQAIAGHVKTGIVATGTVERPEAAVTIDGTGLTLGADTVDKAEISLNLAPQADNRFRLSGNGKLTGVAVNGSRAPAGLGDDINLNVDATADRAMQAINLAEAAIVGAGTRLEAKGNLANGVVTGHAALSAANLALFGPLGGLPNLAGSADIEADANGPDGHSVTAVLTGHTKDLRLGVPAADAVLGPDIAIDGTGGRGADGQIQIDKLNVTAARATLTGQGRYDPTSSRAGGHAVLTMASLTPLGAALGSPLAGSMTMTADAPGTAASPGAVIKLDGSDISAGTTRIKHLLATVTADDLAKRAARILVTMEQDTVQARLGASVAQPAPDRITVRDIALTGPATDLHGALQINPQTSLATGAITGNAGDLSGWMPLVGQKLGGQVALSLNLTNNGGQGLDGTVNAEKLVMGEGKSAITASRIHLDSRLLDLLRKPRGTANLELAGVQSGNLALTSGQFRGNADRPGQLAFDVTGNGQFSGQPVSLAGKGDCACSAVSQSLTLASLTADYRSLKARLTRPLRLSHKGKSIDVHDLALALNQGSITGDVTLDDRHVALTLKGNALPLGTLAEVAGRDGVSGVGAVDLTLNGPLGNPMGDAKLGLDRLIATADAHEPLNVTTSATLRDHVASMTGRIAGTKGNVALDLSGHGPVAFSPAGVPSLPADGAIGGRAVGNGRLEALSEIIPLGEDKAAGQYAIDLSVAGTIAAPQAGGTFTLTDGSYDNSLSGMTLRKLNVDVAGDGHRFALKRLDATDGTSGQISATGDVDLDPQAGPHFAVDATVKSFTAARRDDLTPVLSGTARVDGSLAAPRISADLSIDRADINIPKRLPASIPTLNVVRIDSSRSQAEQEADRQAAERAQAAAVVAALDIKLHDRGQTFVRGDGLDSEWKGDLAVTGTTAAPQVNGSLEAINGTFSILGKDFVVQRGVVTFTGSLNPSFDLLAQAQTADITALVEAQGTPAAPKITLSSTPALPQDEVLSRLMFGSGVGQVTPAQGLQIAAAAASLAGGGGPGILDRLRNATGLDRLSVGQDQASNTSSGGSGVASGTTVSGGKYVAPGVFVGVDQGVSGGSTRARVELDVTQHITANAVAGASGNSGSSVGVQYKLDY